MRDANTIKGATARRSGRASTRASDALRGFYGEGRESLKQYPNRLPYGEAAKDSPAARSAAELLRQARIVSKRYSSAELESLLKAAERGGCSVTIGQLIRLATVPALRRREIEKEMVKRRLNRRQLDQLIRQRCGNRGHISHRLKLATEADAKYAIVRTCGTFQSLLASLRHEPTDDGGRPLWDRLPVGARRALERLDVHITKLKRDMD